MNEDAFCGFDSFFYEVENGVGGFVLGVEDDLVVLVQPEEGEVGYSYGLPVIRHLLSCTIDDMRNFIGDYKLNVL